MAGRELEEVDRTDSILVGEMLFEQLARPPQTGRVDTDPPVPGAHEGDPSGLGARQVSGRDRRVVDDRTPLDECLLAELGFAVVGRGLACFATDAHLRSDEVFGTEQLDAATFEFGRRDVEEVVGVFDGEFDPRRLVFHCERGQRCDGKRNGLGQRQHLLLQLLEVADRARQIQGARRSAPDVVCRTPSAGVRIVDEFEINQPGVERIVGQGEPHSAAHHRLTIESTSVPCQPVPELLHRDIEVVGAGTNDGIGFCEGREHGSGGLHVHAAFATEVGLPTGMVQDGSGEPVDEQCEDVFGGSRGAVATNRWSDSGRMCDRLGSRGIEYRFPSCDGERPLLDHGGRDATSVDQLHRVPHECPEPGQRRREVVTFRCVRQPDGRTVRVETHRGNGPLSSVGQLQLQARELAERHRRVVPTPLSIPTRPPKSGVQPCR